MSEKLCLQWNDFNDRLICSVGALKNDSNFTDVTLACEDGTQVEAHKVILASSSPRVAKCQYSYSDHFGPTKFTPRKSA